MRSERELFNLAKDMVYTQDQLAKETVYPYEKEELKEHANQIRQTLFEKGYDVNKFIRYQELYKEMTISEYFEFIKTLK